MVRPCGAPPAPAPAEDGRGASHQRVERPAIPLIGNPSTPMIGLSSEGVPPWVVTEGEVRMEIEVIVEIPKLAKSDSRLPRLATQAKGRPLTDLR